MTTSRLKSTINARPNADPEDPAPLLGTIKGLSGLDDGKFAALLSSVTAEVEKHYEADEFDRVFKGKWYKAILHADLLDHFGSKPVNKVALEARLTAAIAQTLDVGGAWAKDFAAPLKALAQKYLPQ